MSKRLEKYTELARRDIRFHASVDFALCLLTINHPIPSPFYFIVSYLPRFLPALGEHEGIYLKEITLERFQYL